MHKSLFFCQSWSMGYKEALGLTTSEWAENRHKSGEQYTVLLGSCTKPSCLVELLKNQGWISVSFLDKYLREYLSYSFKILDQEKLFLSMAIHREFIDALDTIKNGTCYIFKENGQVTVRKENTILQTLEEEVIFADVSKNYDQFPKFGSYDSLIKIER